MKQFLNRNLVSLIVLGLLVVLYLQRCAVISVPTVPQNTHDTLVIEKHYYHDSIIVSKPVIYNHIDAKPSDIPLEMHPDTSGKRLAAQYDSLLQLYYSKNISKDSLRIDSIGTVATIDTTQGNRIIGRQWKYNFDIKEKTTIITNNIYQKQKLQLYAGFGVLGKEYQLVNGVQLGVLLKNKRDQIYGVSAQKVIGWPMEYMISSYWKLKLHKGP